MLPKDLEPLQTEVEMDPLQGYIIITDDRIKVCEMIERYFDDIAVEEVSLTAVYDRKSEHILWDFLKEKDYFDTKALLLFLDFHHITPQQMKDLVWHMDIFSRPELSQFQAPYVGSVFLMSEESYRLYKKIKNEMSAIRPISLVYWVECDDEEEDYEQIYKNFFIHHLSEDEKDAWNAFFEDYFPLVEEFHESEQTSFKEFLLDKKEELEETCNNRALVKRTKTQPW